MILRRYLHTEPVVAASYLLGCGGRGVGAVVDPVEDIEPYLRESKRHGIPSIGRFVLTDEDVFVRLMLDDVSPRPPHAEEIRARNLGRIPAAR